MTKEELRKKYDNAFLKFITHSSMPNTDDLFFALYALMWNKVAHKISMYNYASYMKEHCTDISNMTKCIHGEEKQDDKYDDIIIDNSYLKMMKLLDKAGIAYITMHYDTTPVLITEDKTIIITYGSLIVYADEDRIPKWCEDGLVLPSEDSSSYEYLIYDKDGFTTMPLTIKKSEIDIKMNYNDDLPDKAIRNFLDSDESGLIILHGKPGSGKSHYIRDLITSVDRDFLYMDQSAFDYIKDATFIRTLSEYENAVLILEDCESMLISRLDENNKLNVLLNLTDGILGDSFKFKVICTFNANISKIDNALLRKGRLKVKYEFKELSADKVQKLAKKLGKKREKKPMMLTDVYNDDSDIVTSGEHKKMGFV